MPLILAAAITCNAISNLNRFPRINSLTGNITLISFATGEPRREYNHFKLPISDHAEAYKDNNYQTNSASTRVGPIGTVAAAMVLVN